ncbi:MAG: translation initiation factor IF-2 [Puniceicoccales bacterium]|jgi:translation initiation factor IF-2|nr:translation initiation factor IF-2 [Puniceicoccales bacterium]
MSIRVYQLAKELGLENKIVMTMLSERGLKITSPSNSVPTIYADALIRELNVGASKTSENELPSSIKQMKKESTLREEVTVVHVGNEPVRKVSTSTRKTTVTLPAVRPVATKIIRPPEKPMISKPSTSVLTPSVSLPEKVKPKEKAKEEESRVKNDATISDEVTVLIPKPKTASAHESGNMASKTLAPKIPSVIISRAPVATSAEKSKPNNGEMRVVQMRPPIIVKELAPIINLKPFQLISELMKIGVFSSMNQSIGEDIAMKVAALHGFRLDIKHRNSEQKNPGAKAVSKPVVQNEILPRSPIVCVLGHVDHGKTTLLDAIRKTKVAEGEAGGITQRIGAYQVNVDDKGITFIDTPGHAAFSKMRERGADVTDIAILVVAADDGFMPQTDEALRFAKKAGVPVVVAINKMDVYGANIDRIKQQMQQRDIVPEEWGGDTLYAAVSAITGQKIDELLNLVLLQAEMMDLKADFKANASGVVIESQIDAGRGTSATVIVKNGILKIGSVIICGECYCRVRAMINDNGKNVKQAAPATPVVVTGWSAIPTAGSSFEEVKNEKEAREMAEEFATAKKRTKAPKTKSDQIVDIKKLFAAIESQKQKTLNIIVKCDVNGSIEAVIECFKTIKTEKVLLNILSTDVGIITKNDINMADSTDATIVGFNVKLDNEAAALAKNKSVKIIQHDIIYELVIMVRDAMADLLDFDLVENHLGTAQIRKLFTVSKATVAGCMVIDGRILRDKPMRVHRNNKVIFDGKIESMRREKDDQTEVRAGFECGIKSNGFNDYEIGDQIECYEVLQHRQSL